MAKICYNWREMKNSDDPIIQAAQLLKSGAVVAFPTETVYGLGADAENAAAVAKIFELKGRPRNHPLIVHLADAQQLPEWAREIPETAWDLAAQFWPGPLTLILKRGARAIDATTGGHDTIGLRVPAHPLALALLRAFGGGIAAPSANRFGAVSPTSAEHVRAEFGDDLPMILDGGPCGVGVESTIVDLIGKAPAILRPGGVTREQLEGALDTAVPHLHASKTHAPGQLASHYAPRAEVILVHANEAAERENALRADGKKVALLSEHAAGNDSANLARSLYSAMREADASGADVLLAILPDETGLGLAIADRLKKAAAPRPPH